MYGLKGMGQIEHIDNIPPNFSGIGTEGATPENGLTEENCKEWVTRRTLQAGFVDGAAHNTVRCVARRALFYRVPGGRGVATFTRAGTPSARS
jgi:hypothetical protein